MTERADSLRVVLLTALKDEYDQVLRVNNGAIEDDWTMSTAADGRLVASRSYHAAGSLTLRVTTTWASAMGGVASATLASTLLDTIRPHCLAMCGICAGKRGKVSQGDVIFADRLWTYDAGKRVARIAAKGQRVEQFYGDMLQYQLAPQWKQWIETYQFDGTGWLDLRPIPIEHQANWVLLCLLRNEDPRTHPERQARCPDWAACLDYLRTKGFVSRRGLELTRRGVVRTRDLELRYIDGVPEGNTFRVHIGPIATGSSVIQDATIFDWLGVSMRQVLGLEMEASALGMVGALKGAPVVVAKGVADYADADKDDRFRTFAARASAECLLGFLRASLPSLLGSTANSALVEHGLAATQRAGPNLLPRDVATFTGRTAEVERVIRDLNSNSTSRSPLAVAIDAIEGMAGIGKTALAVHLAHLLAPEYPDGQLFIDLHGYTPGKAPVTAGAALDRLLRAMGIAPNQIPDELDDRAALWRAEMARRRAVLVLDNASSPEQVKPLLPGTAGTCVLITSRRRLTGLDGVEVLALGVLPPEEAVELLRRVAGPACADVPDEALSRVAAYCGYLPLAVQLVGNRWRHRAVWPVADLLAQLADHGGRLALFSADSIAVARAFALSYEGLSPEQQLFFRRLGLHPGTSLTPQTAAVLTGRDETKASTILEQLADNSLLQEPRHLRYSFHDLLRDYAHQTAIEQETGAERLAAQQALLTYYVQSISAIDSVLEPHRHQRDPILRAAVQPIATVTTHRQALQWMEDERPNALACLALAHEINDKHTVCLLSHALAYYLSTAGYCTDARRVHQQALSSATDLADDRLVATALTDLGDTYLELGDFQNALEHSQRAAACWHLLHDLESEARALNNVGFTLERTGSYEEALTYLDRALLLHRDRSNHYGEAKVLNAIGAVRWRMQQYELALTNFRAALSIRDAIGDRYGQARTANNIGFTYQRLGNYAAAADWLHRALNTARDAGDRQSEMTTLNNLGYTLERMGEYALAVSYAQLGLEYAQQSGSLYEQGRALDAIARCAAAQGDAQAAEANWQAALSIFVQEGVPEVGELRHLLSNLRRQAAS